MSSSTAGAPVAAVIGWPVKHSRSPLIHRHWLARYGIAGDYVRHAVAPEEIDGFLANFVGGAFVGANVTVPHKEAAFAAVARADGVASALGAVNTLWLEKGELVGGNTDAHGFAANLDEHAPGWNRNGAALVLGAGGAARAVVHALKARDIGDIRIVNRTLARAKELAHRFCAGVSAHEVAATEALMADTGLLVNTTSLGMQGHEGQRLPADPRHLPAHAIVTDIVYVPLETPLLAAARQRGLATVDGLGMLLHQAAPGFERWFGLCPQVTPALRALIVADLGGRTA